MADNFYFQGKYFKTQEEFWTYVNEWPYLKTDEETINRLMDNLKKDIILNFKMYEMKLTNGKMNLMIQEVFLLMIKSLMENENKFEPGK